MDDNDRRLDALCASTRTLTAALSARDAHTQEHADRVIGLAIRLARACALSEQEVRTVRLTAALHDVGKIGIPDHILLKPGRLDAEEWVIMRTHARTGAHLLRATGLPDLEDIASAVERHHEHFDGSGYPDGLRGEQIPIAARIVLICDAYDAMASPRPYHRARTHGEVMTVLESDVGVKSDPALFRLFSGLPH